VAHSWPSRVCAPCGGPARARQAASTGRAARPCVSSRARACPGARAVRGSALTGCPRGLLRHPCGPSRWSTGPAAADAQPLRPTEGQVASARATSADQPPRPRQKSRLGGFARDLAITSRPARARRTVQRRCPLDQGLYEGADVRREKVALGINDRYVVLGFYDTGEHLHEHAAFEKICDQDPSNQRDPQPLNGGVDEKAEVVRRERAIDVRDAATGSADWPGALRSSPRAKLVKQEWRRSSFTERGVPCSARYAGDETATTLPRRTERATRPGCIW
jgi:hypothetical protein